MQETCTTDKRKHARRLYRKACEITRMIMQNYNVGEYDAIAEFYRSATYKLLADYNTKIWWYSVHAIFEIYKTEKSSGSVLNSPYILGECA